jgi:hypothetical protein
MQLGEKEINEANLPFAGITLIRFNGCISVTLRRDTPGS